MRRLLPALLLLAGLARASGGGSSGAEFLRTGMGARPAGFGENFTGLADDVTAAAWNPAGLGRLDRVEFTGMHYAALGDVAYEFMAASYPVGGWGSLAFSAAYAGAARFDSTAPGSGVAPASLADTAAALSWGGCFKNLSDERAEYSNLFYGGTARIISRSIGGYTPPGGVAKTLNATGYAADVGVLYQATKAFSAGLAAQNLGTPITFLNDEGDALPVMIRGGLAWIAVDRPGLRTLVLSDVTFPVDPDGGTFASSTWGGAGAEAVLFDLLALRGGFRMGPDGTRVVGGAGLTFRLGSLGFGLDGAVIPLGDFGTGWRAGMTVKMSAVEKRLGGPANFSVSALPEKKVLIRWSPLAGAVGYQVEVRTPGTTAFRRLTKAARTVPELTITLKAQKPGTEYAFRVVAVAESGREGRSADVIWTVPAAAVVAAPGTPATLKVTVGTGRRITLAWTPVSGATGYWLYLKGASGKWTKLTKALRVGTTMALKPMKPGSYTFGVTAVSVGGKAGKAKAAVVRIK